MGDDGVLRYELVERRGPQDRLLLLIHGYGQPIEELASRVDLLDPQGRYLVALPIGPLRKKGRPIWHRALNGDTEESEEQFATSLAALDDLLDVLCERTGLPRAEAVVGGFSQGAGLATALFVRASDRPRPAADLSFCGFLPPVAGAVDLAAVAGRPVFFGTGDADHYFNPVFNEQMAAALDTLGMSVTHRAVTTAHVMTDELAELAAPWLADVADGRAPAPSTFEVADNPVIERLTGAWEHA